MKTILTIATAVFALAWGSASQAGLMVDVDTATDLVGSWEFADAEAETVTIVNFADLMPDGVATAFGGFRSPFSRVVFGTGQPGNPDDPFFSEVPGGSLINFPELIGSYNNNSLQTDVFFRFYNIVDTGEDDGAFSGDFCFSTDRANLDVCADRPPVPSPAVPALLGLGLVLLRLSRRSSAA